MENAQMTELGTQRSCIRELFEYGKIKAAEVGAENVFDFSLGNPSTPPPAAVTAEALRLLQTAEPVSLHGYTSAQGDLAVRSAIAESLNRRYGTAYTPQNLYMTCGAAAALCCCFRGLFTPGSECIVFAPYFPEYKVFIEANGGIPVVVPPDERFQPDFGALETAITANTRAVVVNSPNNPSGAVYTAETLRKLAALLTKKSAQFGSPIFLISDEPYREVVYDGVTVPWIPALYPHTIVCYSYSKALSLPGERIGYALVPNSVADWQNVYAALCGAGRSMGYVNAPSLFQRVVARCCDCPPDLSVYAENRSLLLDCFGKLGLSCAPAEGTFYLFLKAPNGDGSAFSAAAKEHNLLLVPGEDFGCPDYVRLSYCVPTGRVLGALPVFARLL
ncbi:MAG: pyridoxal phosphate-dependent aminotransferase [Oscillospiraceae bacterium]